ncbi:hypothetical protein R6Q59_030866 [Mikania micrantha]
MAAIGFFSIVGGIICRSCIEWLHESMPENTVRIFTLDELHTATQNFNQPLENGDESGFESVYMGLIASSTYPYDNIQVVVKRGKRLWEIKVRLLAKIKHENLVKLIGYCNEDYETDEKVIFKDFKPSNIRLDNQMNAKLLYLGFVKEAPQDGPTQITISVVKTKGYSAPEFIQKTTKMEVWSYGIFLQELITGELPVVEENLNNNPKCIGCVCCNADVGTSNLIVDPNLEGRYSKDSMQKLASIAINCLVLEPKRRPKMSAVLKLVKEAIAFEMSSLQLPNA